MQPRAEIDLAGGVLISFGIVIPISRFELRMLVIKRLQGIKDDDVEDVADLLTVGFCLLLAAAFPNSDHRLAKNASKVLRRAWFT